MKTFILLYLYYRFQFVYFNYYFFIEINTLTSIAYAALLSISNWVIIELPPESRTE